MKTDQLLQISLTEGSLSLNGINNEFHFTKANLGSKVQIVKISKFCNGINNYKNSELDDLHVSEAVNKTCNYNV